MKRQLSALLLAGIAALTACGGGGYGGGGTTPPAGGGGGGGTPPPGVGAQTIGMAIPTSAIGSVNTHFGIVGGYTQKTYSQTLAFPPGTTITLKNLGLTAHTLNVLSMSAFPANPTLDATASGSNSLAAGFRSGAIAPGGTMQITLSTPGTYFIGCAFHYLTDNMRDVLMVSSSATPGPQATPQPSGGGSGGCGGIYC